VEEIDLSVEPALFPVDLKQIFLNELKASRREPDGLLHCSSDLISPLRFVQLRAVGAPMVQRPVAQDIRMMHGTLWHEWFHASLKRAGIKFMFETNLDKYFPEGWGGTADWIFWHPAYDAWVLGDLKTIRGEGIFFIDKKGAKEEHLWQLSAYWHAIHKMGLPLVKGFGVFYWPMNDTRDTVDIEPSLQEGVPYPEDEVLAQMAAVKASVSSYKAAHGAGKGYLNSQLAPMPEREQKVYWNKSVNAFEVKLYPHWMEGYCDFDNELCPRSGTTKIGQYGLSGVYKPRRGYENVLPEVKPSAYDYRKRQLGRP